MEWKNYIQSLLLIAFCYGMYHLFQSKKITEPTEFFTMQETIDNKSYADINNQTAGDNKFFDEDNNEDDETPYKDSQDQVEPEHHYIELSKKIFTTTQERKELFNELGMEYLDHEVFDYTPAQTSLARLTDMFLEDPETYEFFSELYKDNVAAKTLAPMSIRWLGQDIGYGVFAEKDIENDEFIGLYTGSIQDRSLVESKDYAWFYPATTLDGGTMSLDACWQGNELRFINDGANPNCRVQYIIGHDDLWHVCYVACTDIKKGQQLLVSYGPEYWNTRSYKYQEFADAN